MQKTFIDHNLPSLEQINTDDGRFYKTPSGILYPSVTTVIGHEPNESIEVWKQAVGEIEANKVSSRATRRGTRIHGYCENYLRGLPLEFPSKPERFLFNSLVPILDKFDNIRCLETRLYSDYLRSAGTVDILADWYGKRYVGDFKTSNREKYKSEIEHYFVQAATYAVMFEERTGIPTRRLLIIIAVESDQPQVFEENRDNWIGSYIEIRNKYDNFIKDKHVKV